MSGPGDDGNPLLGKLRIILLIVTKDLKELHRHGLGKVLFFSVPPG